MVPQALVDGAGAILAAAQAEHLRGAGLAGGLVGRAGEGAPRRAGAHHVRHGALDHVDVLLLERDAVVERDLGRVDRARARVANRVHQVRTPIQAAVGQGRGGLRQLQQRERVVALPDRHGNRFAGIPALAIAILVGLALPFGGRQHPGLLAFQVDAGDLSETELLGKIVQRVHADLGAERIEIGIGRHHDGAVHVRHAIGGAAGVTEFLAAELEIARIGHAVGGAPLAQLQRGQGHERLVGRADGIGAVQRPVDQRMVGRLVQAAPILDVDPVDEQVGIERGLRNERQDFAGIGIERNQRAAPPLEGLFRQLLQLQVDRQHDVRARHRVDAAQGAHGASAGRDLDLFQAGAAMQGGLPGFLDALLADDVGAAVVAQLAGLVQFFDVVLGDPADEADHVRRGLALRIFAHPARTQLDAREFERMRREPGGLGVVEVVAQLQAGIAAGFAHPALEAALVGRADVHDPRQAIEQLVQVAGLGRHDLQGIGAIVARQDFAVAVQDLASPRRDGHDGDTVPVRPLGEALVAVDLQVPEPARQHAEAGQREQAAHPGAQAKALLLLLAGFLEFEHAPARIRRRKIRRRRSVAAACAAPSRPAARWRRSGRRSRPIASPATCPPARPG
ncbi:Uncharacterised protein [Bordetella pertussis]|nr:Uncharacterised protein [Bordetella pertussis]